MRPAVVFFSELTKAQMKNLAVGASLLAVGLFSLCGCSELGSAHESAAHQENHHPDSKEAEVGNAHSEAHGKTEGGEEEGHQHKIVVTSPLRKDITSTRRYVCQIHSCQHIELRALEGGYLEKICVKEGQAVRKGDLLFKILPTLHQARLDSEIAEANRIQIELNNLEALLQKQYISDQAIALKKAELAKAQAKVGLAKAELGFTNVTAPFDGIVDRQHNQQGSLISEGDVLTTFSDNSRMWVYFNVPEAQYLEYVADMKPAEDLRAAKDARQVKLVSNEERDDEDRADDDREDAAKADDDDEAEHDNDDRDDEDDDNDDQDDDDKQEEVKRVNKDDKDLSPAAGFRRFKIELELANGKTFPQPGKIGAIEADFNNTTGNIPFRADFPNPDSLLRNGQTGTILVHSTLSNVVVIPQRATYSILAKRYAYVVDKDNVVHQRDITVELAQDDIFVISEGLDKDDRIILEGIRQVRDGDKIEYEFVAPEKVLSNLKYHAE